MPIETDEGFELMRLVDHIRDTDSGDHSCDEQELTGVIVHPAITRASSCSASDADTLITRRRVQELLEAFITNDVEQVTRMLTHEDITSGVRLGKKELTYVHLAALHGSTDVLDILLDRGAKPSLADKEGRTPLHLAVWMGHTACADTLVKRCPDLVHRAVKKSSNHTTLNRIYTTWLDTDSSDDIPPLRAGLTPLHLASQKADIECVQLLLAEGAVCNALDENKLTPLDLVGEKIPKDIFERASDSFLQVINALIAKGGQPTSQPDNNYYWETPMHIAVSLKCVDAVPVLAEAGYNTPLKNQSGNSPLHIAICQRSEDPSLLNKLVEMYRLDGIESRNKAGETPLHIAVQKQWLLAVRTLLVHGADITAEANKGKTVLHMVAAKKNHVIMKELLDHPNSSQIVNKVDSEGNTPLFLSIHTRHYKCVSLLLDHAADLTQLDSKQRTVLHCAIEDKHTRVLEELFCHNKEAMKNMIDRPTAMSNDLGQTALHIAASKNNFKGAQILINQKCNLRAKAKYDGRSVTALHLATMKGHGEIVKILLRADPLLVDESDEIGMRAIHWACINRHSKIITMLVGAGSDLSAKCTYPSEGVTRSAMDLLIHRVPCSVDLLNTSMDSSFKVKKTFIEIDYKILLSKETSKDSNCKSQMQILTALVETGDQVNQQSLFMHPLIESFLHLQWKRIEVFYYVLIMAYAMFVIPFSVLVIIIFHSKEIEMSESPLYRVYVCLRAIIAISSSIHIAHQVLYMFYKSHSLYNKTCDLYYKTNKSGWFKWEFPTKSIISILNLILRVVEIVFTSMIFLIIIIDPTDADWFSREVATGAILLFYVEFMLLVSRVPTYGFYMLMFFEVTTNFFVVLLSFTFLIVGFMITFYIEFKAEKPFDSGSEAFLKTIVMMTNEFEYNELFQNLEGNMKVHLFTKVVFLLFLLLVGIVIMNILLAKAISDVKKVDRLRKQAEFLSTYEHFLSLPYLKSKPIESKQQIQFDKDMPFPEKLMHTIFDKAFKVSNATKAQYKETQKKESFRKDLNYNNSLIRNNDSNESSLNHQSNEQKLFMDLLTKKIDHLSEIICPCSQHLHMQQTQICEEQVVNTT